MMDKNRRGLKRMDKKRIGKQKRGWKAEKMMVKRMGKRMEKRRMEKMRRGWRR